MRVHNVLTRCEHNVHVHMYVKGVPLRSAVAPFGQQLPPTGLVNKVKTIR